MIRTVTMIALRRLRHGKTELMLTFLVPIVFFSIFAMIFGSGIGRNPRVRTLLVDADATELTQRVLADLHGAAGLKPTLFNAAQFSGDDLNQEAERLVREGQFSAAVVIPKQFTDSFRTGETPPVIRVLSDSSNQVAAQVVGAVVQKTTLTTLGDERAKVAASEVTTLGLPPGMQPADKRSILDTAPVEVVDVLGESKSNPLIAMSAAGIAVMFLLFSAAGSGGSLLEEEESGTLERLLTSQLTMTELLVGKWIFIAVQGVAQVVVMFLWGHLVFDVDLFSHLSGFSVMTFATSAAAASFALLLATACQSRTQLNGVSTILILTMSALGGSMVPRYVMSESMQQWGLITFNAWALDGYNKVFWRDLPVSSLTPQVSILIATSIVMMLGARVLARRWETT